MANILPFFMGPDDERVLLGELAPLGLLLYPIVVPQNYKAQKVEPGLSLQDPAGYLAVPSAGPVQVDKVKRGPDRGSFRILEVISPVIHWQRSVLDEDGALRSGRLWAELQVSGDVQKRVQKSSTFEGTFHKIEAIVRRRARRSDPTGYWILPDAVRLWDQGVPLVEDGRNGKPVRPFR